MNQTKNAAIQDSISSVKRNEDDRVIRTFHHNMIHSDVSVCCKAIVLEINQQISTEQGGEGIDDWHLRAEEKSKPIPNLADPNSSHVHIEDGTKDEAARVTSASDIRSRDAMNMTIRGVQT